MAKTKIENELSSLVGRIISSQSIDDMDKENFRRQARQTMQAYGRVRTFLFFWRYYGILTAALILVGIIVAVSGKGGQNLPMLISVASLGFIGIIVFAILTHVFRSKYRTLLSNLEGEFSTRERKGKGTTFPVNPFVCIAGPFFSSYSGQNVEIRSKDDRGLAAGYLNLSMAFIESANGGEYDLKVKKYQGSFSVEPNECAIILASIVKKTIVFEKQTIKLAESTVFATEVDQSPAVVETAPVVVAPPVVQRPVKPAPVSQTANELIEISEFDTSAESISVAKGKMSFLVLNNDVCDALKPGDYFVDIDVFQRLKALNPNALSSNSSLKLITLDTEKVYQLHWKLVGNVFAKGDVEFHISNPRLFLNCAIEDGLMSKEQFEEEVVSVLNPSLRKALENEKGSDYDLIEKNLLKAVGNSLEKIGLSIKFVGLAAFSKEEVHDERHCVHCGKAIPADSVYCSYCGRKQDNNICSNCGAEIPDGAAFCPKCGTKKGTTI